MRLPNRLAICVLPLFALVLTLFAGNSQNDVAIRVGVFQAPPMVHIGADGRYSGVVIEILEAIAADEAWRIEYIPGTWPQILDRLKDGSIDMLCLLADRPERREWAVFNTEPLYVEWGQLWRTQKSDIRNHRDLEGKTIIGVVDDVFSADCRRILENEGLNVNYLEVPGYQALMDMVRAGTADAVVLNRIFNPEPYKVQLKKTDIIFSPIPIYFGFPKNRPLSDDIIQRLDTHLIRMKQSGDTAYSRAFNRWVGDSRSNVYSAFSLTAVAGGVIAAGALLVFLILNRRLRDRERALMSAQRQVEELTGGRMEVEEQYRRLFNTINDGIIVFDLSLDGVLSNISLVNKQACLIVGRSEMQMLGCSPVEYVSEKERHKIPELAGALQARHALLFQIGIETKDGTERLVEIHATLIEQDGKWQVLAVIRDISERLMIERHEQRRLAKLEEQFQQRTMEIDEISREVNLLAGTVSHDLQGPLKVVQETLERIRKKLVSTDPKVEEELDRAIVQVQKINNLIKGILEYSRLSRNDLELIPLGLSQVCSEVLLQLDEMIRSQHADVIIERPMPRVIGHSNTLFRVIQNLVVNAIKFVEPGKKAKVILRAESRESSARLWIIDNGIGIAPEYHDRIFNVFQRLHGSEEYFGNGLGLAIVRRGMQRMHGSVGLVSEVGEGSRFWIELPLGPTD